MNYKTIDMLYARKLILGERIMYVDGMTPVNCVFPVSLRGHFSAEQVKAALRQLQRKHPLLRVRIQKGLRGRPYFLSDGTAPEIPVRVEDSKPYWDWVKVVQEEWVLPWESRNGPLARVVLLPSEDKTMLFLTCPHCICDGATGTTLMRELLYLLDQPGGDIGPSYQGFRSVKELLGREDKRGWWKGYLKSLVARAFFSLKPLGKVRTAGEAWLEQWQLDEGMSSMLIQQCREQGVTVHAALCVAFLEAYERVKGDAVKGKVICPVDIRRYVRAIKKDTMFAFAPIIELSGASAARGAEFWARCRSLKGELTQKMADVRAGQLLLQSEFYHGIAGKLIRFLCTDPGGHDFTFSNMGRLEIPEEFEHFSVENIYSPTVSFPWRNPTTIVVSSYRGKMDFAYVSNTAFLPQEEGVKIREGAMHRLMDVVGYEVRAKVPANLNL